MSFRFVKIALLVLAAPAAALAFEGLIDYEIQTSGEKKPLVLSYAVKGAKIRVESGRDGAMILEPAARTAIVLSAGERMAIKQTLPDPKDGKKGDAKGKFEFVNTGKKETVAGRVCTVYTYKAIEGEGEICSAEGMGNFMFAAGKGENTAWEKEIASRGLFPLRMAAKDLKTGKTTTMKAVRVEAKSLPSSDFEIPRGYQVIEPGQGFPGAAAPAPAKGSKKAGFNPADMMKKMMNASPEEQERMAEEMQKQYGGAQ